MVHKSNFWENQFAQELPLQAGIVLEAVWEHVMGKERKRLKAVQLKNILSPTQQSSTHMWNHRDSEEEKNSSSYYIHHTEESDGQDIAMQNLSAFNIYSFLSYFYIQ